MKNTEAIAGIAMLLTCLAASAPAAGQSGFTTTLTVKGKNGSTIGSYTLDKLHSSFKLAEIKTATPWSPNQKAFTFRGVLLADILRANQIYEGRTEIVVAGSDGFKTEIPIEDINAYHPIIGVQRACEIEDFQSKRCKPQDAWTNLTIDEYGPLFMVWPMDKLPTTYQPTRNNLWVWFVDAVNDK